MSLFQTAAASALALALTAGVAPAQVSIGVKAVEAAKTLKETVTIKKGKGKKVTLVVLDKAGKPLTTTKKVVK